MIFRPPARGSCGIVPETSYLLYWVYIIAAEFYRDVDRIYEIPNILNTRRYAYSVPYKFAKIKCKYFDDQHIVILCASYSDIFSAYTLILLQDF
jgi:hypothetical protein